MTTRAYGPDGHLLALVDDNVAQRYVDRGDAGRFREGIQLRASRATPLRELTWQEKQAIARAKERAKR